MQKDTKKIIKETFLDLLRAKPFDKITIRDIVEACGINRNTFYYYYSDIYDLLEEIFRNELEEIESVHKTNASWLMGFAKVALVAYNNKKIVNNICASRSYDYFESYMLKSCRYIVVDLVNEIAEGMEVPDEDIEFIASFYEYAFFGVISEWFRTGMRETPEQLASNMWLILGNIQLSLRRSQKRYREQKKNGD